MTLRWAAWMGILLSSCAAPGSGDPTFCEARQVAWEQAPGMPPGLLTAPLYGDPRSGPYQVLIQMPTGAAVEPHYHRVDEFATVISGALLFGSGDLADESRGSLAREGDSILIPAGTGHWARCRSDALVARFAPGPRELTRSSPEHPAPNRSGQIRILRPSELRWEPAPGKAPGIERALAYGDREQGPCLVLERYPAGLEVRAEPRSKDQTLTLLRGTMVAGKGGSPDGGEASELGPGGFLVVPGGALHWARMKREVILLRLSMGPLGPSSLDPK